MLTALAGLFGLLAAAGAALAMPLGQSDDAPEDDGNEDRKSVV